MALIDKSLDIWTAAERGMLDEIRQFVANGLSVNAKTRGDVTPLHKAASAGQVEVIRWLLDHGAEINARTCAERGYPGAETPLYLAVVHGKREASEILIKRGANPNLKSSDGTSVLAEASQVGDLRIMELLIDSGAKVNSGGDFSPLFTAVSMKNLNATKLLIDHGARINEKVLPYSSSLLSTAASAKWLRGVEFFLSLALPVNEADDSGQTALHYAVLGYGSRQLSWVKTERGEKCIREEPEEALPVVKRLLEAGADSTIRDKSGFTSVDYAKKLRAQRLLELLCQTPS